jgi:hypothetical protein
LSNCTILQQLRRLPPTEMPWLNRSGRIELAHHGTRSVVARLQAIDQITAALAKGDAGVVADLQGLFLKTRAATRVGGAQ